MSSKKASIYNYPHQMEREYYLLMKSRITFSKNLSSVEQRKLNTLYEELESAWNQNNIELLNSTLNRKYKGLRILQSELNQNKKNIEVLVEQIGNQEIESNWRGLKMKRQNLRAKKEILEKNLKTWSQDIIQKEAKLMTSKEMLMKNQEIFSEQKNKVDLALKEEDLKITELENEYQKISKLKESLLKTILKEEMSFQMSLNKIKQENSTTLNQLADSLKMKRSQLTTEETESIKAQGSLRNKLEENLKQEEETLLKEWILRNSKDLNSYPQAIIQLFKDGNYSMISKQVQLNLKEFEQRLTALKKNISKIGKTEEWYFARFDESRLSKGS